MDYKIFDTLLEPIFIIDEHKKVIYCNEPVSIICDMSVRKICRGQVFDELITFPEPLDFLGQLSQITEPTPYKEISFTAVSGKTGKVQLTCQPIEGTSANQKNWIIFFRDVTLEETLQKKYRAELEQVQHYSKNLEKMVDERTAQIKKLNEMMSALLDSLGQGFFIFDQTGKCLEVYSKACETTVEAVPSGLMIWDILKLESKQVPGFQKWMKTIYSEMLPFEDLSPLGPQTFPHSQGKHIQLEYFPLRKKEGPIDGVVVVATDITNLVEAKKEAEIERAHAKMIVSLIQNKRQVHAFLRESADLIVELNKELQKKLLLNPENTFRILHTLKGGAASFSIKNMADACHESEGVLSEFKWDGVHAKGVEKLQSLAIQIEDFFNRFQNENSEIIGSQEKQKQRWVEIPVDRLISFKSRLSGSIEKEFSEKFILEPIGDFFKNANQVIQTVAESEGKMISELQIINGHIPILPEPYENLFSTFVHAFRNAADHGIERPEIREQSQKNPSGQIQLKFGKYRKGLLIQVIDDGGGINPEKIKEKLSVKGIQTDGLRDHKIIQHIFDSQFSTKEVVSETSGRGVGMDAILHAAKALGGKAWVRSKLGKGTKLFVLVPEITEVKNKLLNAA
jgi:two-component system chemotaxis sensor kinase CheA